MNDRQAVSVFGALAHRHRLSVFRLLARVGPNGLSAGEISTKVGLSPSSLSFHLGQLEEAGLIHSWKLARSNIYALDVQGIRDVLEFLSGDFCGGLSDLFGAPLPGFESPAQAKAPEKNLNVLFLCFGNSARSVMAECVLNREGQARFRAYSAGSHPVSQIDPLVLDLLSRANYPVGGLRSKSWTEFGSAEAPDLDFVITVCDRTARETCPNWQGEPMVAHWGVPDPAEFEGTDTDKRVFVADVFRMLHNRIRAFLKLPIESLDRRSLQSKLDEIGRLQDFSPA